MPTTCLFQLEESLMAEVTDTAALCHTTRSNFIRQSLVRNLDIVRNVELPAIRAYAAQRIPNLRQAPTKGTTDDFDKECE